MFFDSTMSGEKTSVCRCAPESKRPFQQLINTDFPKEKSLSSVLGAEDYGICLLGKDMGFFYIYHGRSFKLFFWIFLVIIGVPFS